MLQQVRAGEQLIWPVCAPKRHGNSINLQLASEKASKSRQWWPTSQPFQFELGQIGLKRERDDFSARPLTPPRRAWRARALELCKSLSSSPGNSTRRRPCGLEASERKRRANKRRDIFVVGPDTELALWELGGENLQAQSRERKGNGIISSPSTTIVGGGGGGTFATFSLPRSALFALEDSLALVTCC